MSVSTVIAIYFLIWWLTLFAVLPWGVRNQEESGEVTPGTDPGAPVYAPDVAQARLDDRVRDDHFRNSLRDLHAGPDPVRHADGDFRTAAPLSSALPKKEQGAVPCSSHY